MITPTRTYGRLYDPVIARFFSPDNFVQAPEFTQSYNRYSYCLNNPLQYVDPSGESFIALGVAIGALTNVLSQMITGNVNSASDFLSSAFIGGFAGVISGIAGNAALSSLGVGGFIGGVASGAASGAAGGAIVGFGNSLVAGNNLSTAIGHGFFSGFVGALGGGLMGGLSSGVLDALNGYDFWNGSRIDEFAVSDTPIVQDFKKMGILYDNSDIAECNDVYLKYRTENVFGIKECDFEIDVITTRTEGYGLTRSGLYVNKQGVSVGGYVRSFSFGSSDLHISPCYTNAEDIPFQAIVGHELLHSYHHYILGASFQRIWSEMVAYQYTYNVYMKNNMYNKAFSTFTIAIKNCYWGYFYPNNYSIPSPYLLNRL